MDGLMAELDGEDEEELQELGSYNPNVTSSIL